MVDYVITKIESEFVKMTVTRDTINRCVCMDIYFKDNKTGWITMLDYLTKYFDAFGEPIEK